MAVSVESESEAARIAAKIENALAGLGLVPNASKTRVQTKAQFRAEHHEDENERLDEVEQLTKANGILAAAEKREFEKNLADFLQSNISGHWSRILRRYSTQSRRSGSSTLTRFWVQHILDHPTNAAHILDYVSYTPATPRLAEEIFHSLKTIASIHEDVTILLYETLLLAPFWNDPILRHYIVRQTYNHMRGLDGYSRPIGHVRGQQALVMFKFGGTRVSKILLKTFKADSLESADYAAYALPVIAADSSLIEQALSAVEQLEDPRVLRVRSLIRLLLGGDRAAIDNLFGLVEPRITKLPERAISNPRGLPLMQIAVHSISSHLVRIRGAHISGRIRSMGSSSLIDEVSSSLLSSL